MIADAKLEPGLAKAEPGERFQFERLGYFCADAGDSQAGKPAKMTGARTRRVGLVA